MIGQEVLQQQFDQWLEQDFPSRFILLLGPSGSGKMTLCREFCRKHKLRYIVPGPKVADIRLVVEFAYKQTERIVFLFDKAESMSEAAKNALLKITEEPPRNAVFMLLADSHTSVPATLVSRGRTALMSSYGHAQLVDYGSQHGYSDDEVAHAADFATTPGEMLSLLEGKVLEMYDFAILVADKLDKVGSANAFKSAGKLAFKKDTEGWDAALFLRMVRKVWSDDYPDDLLAMDKVWITTKALNDMQLVGLSKRATYDMWVLDVRRLTRESA